VSDQRNDESPMNRRRALKVLGALPLAAAVADAQQAQNPADARQGHERPAQSSTANTRQPQSPPRARFFNQREMRTLRVLADDIIPRDARSGSATDAGVPAYVDFHLSVPETSQDVRTAWKGGLRWLDTESRKRNGKAYHLASAAERHAILDDIAGPLGPPVGEAVPASTTSPALRYGAAFFARARDMIGGGFFSSAMGFKDLQYMGNTFNPGWNGCPPAALAKLGVTEDLMNDRPTR
jgi:gluconate 2-dehydrogenase gamma chain